MTTYRTGNHWGVTIVREGDQPTDGTINLARAQLVAVVVNGDQALAERICALLNGEPANPPPVVAHTCGMPVMMCLEPGAHIADPSPSPPSEPVSDLRVPLVPAPTLDGSKPAEGECDCGHEGLPAEWHSRPCPLAPVGKGGRAASAGAFSGDREAARKVNAARPGIETHTARAVIEVLRGMGWTPPTTRRCICNDPPPTVDKPKNGTASRPPGWACPRHGTVI